MVPYRFLIRTSMAATIAFSATIAVACNIPVFRYALERWRPDQCQVIIFHDTDFSTQQEQQLQTFEKATTAGGGSANAEIIRSRIGSEKDRNRKELWETLGTKPGVALPYLVMRTSLGTGELVTHWSGPLQDAPDAKLFDSPTRRELSRRLLAGDSVVWLMLKSADNGKNKAMRDMLSGELERLGKSLKLPAKKRN